VSALLWFLGAVVVCGGLLYLAYRIEPHWVAKDGTRFVSTGQLIDRSTGAANGRVREVRVVILGDGGLMVSRRSFLRTKSGIWRVQAKSPSPPGGRELYLLGPVPADPMDDLLTLRVPAKSRVVPTLDALVPAADPARDTMPKLTAPSDRGTRRWGRRADQG
jgi:hypothetical protein